jgi:putative FmdB family regulatory protein
MPVYEYYCADCDGVFERLLPVSRASESQPCVVCDSDARRLMPTTVNSFVIRDGAPRRIPDRGTFWHREREVSRPISTTVEPWEHPDLLADKYGPPRPPTVEEEEAFAARQEQHLEYQAERVSSGLLPQIDTAEQQHTAQFVQRARETAAQRRERRRRQPNAQVTPRTRSGTHDKPT